MNTWSARQWDIMNCISLFPKLSYRIRFSSYATSKGFARFSGTKRSVFFSFIHFNWVILQNIFMIHTKRSLNALGTLPEHPIIDMPFLFLTFNSCFENKIKFVQISIVFENFPCCSFHQFIYNLLKYTVKWQSAITAF